MSFQTLISASELDHLCRTETDVVILDARFHLDDEDWGDRAFAESHIPGAQRASLATDLSGPIIEGVTGRRPFPASSRLRAHCSIVGHRADNSGGRLRRRSRVDGGISCVAHDALDRSRRGGCSRWRPASLGTCRVLDDV